jgi:hypothetical protein
MNSAEQKIIFAFNKVVNENYHELYNEMVEHLSPKEMFSTLMPGLSKKEEIPYPAGRVLFRTPQAAIQAFNTKEPLYYLDKLMILASFARLVKYNYEVLTVNRKGNVITYLRVWNPAYLLDSFYLAPGLPFNVQP